MDTDEILEIINEKGEILGSAMRSVIHGNPSLIHKVVHILVFNTPGNLLLQKRSLAKDVAPGRWDTSVGGHVGFGEDTMNACRREMEEELGITGHEPQFLYSYIHSNAYETEMVMTYRCVHDGAIVFNRDEIDEVRFWKLKEIKSAIGKEILSDNFEHEFKNFLNISDPGLSAKNSTKLGSGFD